MGSVRNGAVDFLSAMKQFGVVSDYNNSVSLTNKFRHFNIPFVFIENIPFNKRGIFLMSCWEWLTVTHRPTAVDF